jgi:dienelactone hydrolase
VTRVFATSRTASPAGASLRWVHRPADPRGVVLVLHGGQSAGSEPTSWRQLSVLRARLFATAIARPARSQQVAVAFLRYAVRGWNGGSPVTDGRWAMEQLRQLHPDVPVGLFGYSMGGRVALRLTGDPAVRSLVTAAAWVESADLRHVDAAPGLDALLLHGSQDRVTSPQGSAVAAQHLQGQGARARVQTDLDDTHAMMRHARTWHARAAEHLVGALVEA